MIETSPKDEREAPTRTPPATLWRAVFPKPEDRLGERLLRAAGDRRDGENQERALKEVRRAIRLGACVDFPNMDRDERALHLAALADNDQVCEELIGAGANIEAWDFNRQTPLQRAVEAGSVKSVRALLKAGADPNAASGAFKYNALHVAVENNRLEIALMLIEAGACHAPDHRGGFPLHNAWRSAAMAFLLAEAGADPEAKDHEGKTAVEWADNPNGNTEAREAHRALWLEARARREALEIASETKKVAAEGAQTPARARPRV